MWSYLFCHHLYMYSQWSLHCCCKGSQGISSFQRRKGEWLFIALMSLHIHFPGACLKVESLVLSNGFNSAFGTLLSLLRMLFWVLLPARKLECSKRNEKKCVSRFHLSITKHFFTVRMTDQWHRLSGEVVESPSVEIFKVTQKWS